MQSSLIYKAVLGVLAFGALGTLDYMAQSGSNGPDYTVVAWAGELPERLGAALPAKEVEPVTELAALGSAGADGAMALPPGDADAGHADLTSEQPEAPAVAAGPVADCSSRGGPKRCIINQAD